ncbi:MAG: hypothetical protein J0G32_05620 [Alphaproteobacteria bacterium]|nr:hypothetical protein [Alphaproteobacteria bacterium]OJV12031.1 MAG: hypothetical protein BGO27_00395 [Alphaproteobacteria bacterium 33-17]
MVGIISNTTAIGVQASLKKANSETASSSKRLASGERIIEARDDAAGLAIGTSLQGNVITLNAALTNTAQASSLLGVADGALKNIGEILSRQKALATQATSGTLDATTRGYLNLEFKNLKDEINRIAGSTNFNGIKLLDGSIFAPAEIKTDAKANATSVQGVLTFGTAGVAIADGATLTINGTVITFDTTPSSDPRQADATQTTIAGKATALYNAIQNVINSLDPARADDKANLSALKFELNDTLGQVTITSKSSGTEFNSGGGREINITGSVTFAAATDLTLNGTTALNVATVYDLNTAGGVAGVTGDLNAGKFATGGTSAYDSTASTFARGTVSDSILTAIDVVAAAAGAGNATGVNTSGVSNNSAFVGKVSGFKAVYSSPDRVDLSIKVGNYTYQAKNVETTPAADTIVRLSSIEDGGGFFDLQVNDSATSGQTAVTNQKESDDFAARIDKAFEGLNFFQKRTVSSYVAAGSVFPTGGTTQSGNLSGTSFRLINSSFENLKVEKVKVEAPVSGGTEALIEFTINGETFRSGYNNFGVTTALGSSIAAAANIGFVSTTDPQKVLQFTNGAVQIDITNKAEAEGLQKAFEEAFGVGEGGTSLSFQVGTKSTDTVLVQMESSATNNIYRNADGNVVDISIDTLANANIAGDVLDKAISTVTSLRATIGALQSRFAYAASNIQSSIQNQDFARGIFLDTDVASESTNFASSQVRLQASISVLAQANQLPQSLLKLIG